MLPWRDDPPAVRGCQISIGCLLLGLLLFTMTFPWSGFLLFEWLKDLGVRL